MASQRLANLGAAMPALPDRTRWLTLEDANEAAVDAWRDSHPVIKPGSAKQPELQTTAIGDLSVEIEVGRAWSAVRCRFRADDVPIHLQVDPDWMLTEEEMRELDHTQAF